MKVFVKKMAKNVENYANLSKMCISNVKSNIPMKITIKILKFIGKIMKILEIVTMVTKQSKCQLRARFN